MSKGEMITNILMIWGVLGMLNSFWDKNEFFGACLFGVERLGQKEMELSLSKEEGKEELLI